MDTFPDSHTCFSPLSNVMSNLRYKTLCSKYLPEHCKNNIFSLFINGTNGKFWWRTKDFLRSKIGLQLQIQAQKWTSSPTNGWLNDSWFQVSLWPVCWCVSWWFVPCTMGQSKTDITQYWTHPSCSDQPHFLFFSNLSYAVVLCALC